jgi:threonine dehydratase
MVVTLADIQAARTRIADAIFATPCARAEILSELMGCEVFLKLENLHPEWIWWWCRSVVVD